ncbi:hypothetical protein EDB80DRAFT_688580 [Ilyonectria destructans]|nr:hypothetical protein EDB80DRAFT_688580 [Ilyonectria destructans]
MALFHRNRTVSVVALLSGFVACVLGHPHLRQAAQAVRVTPVHRPIPNTRKPRSTVEKSGGGEHGSRKAIRSKTGVHRTKQRRQFTRLRRSKKARAHLPWPESYWRHRTSTV